MLKRLASHFAVVLLGLFVLRAGPAGANDSSPFPGLQPVRVHGTIVDVAVSNPAFSTLVTALTAADLVTTLQGKGPFTVFAPTNAAFAKIPNVVLNYLLTDVSALKNVLLYHVVSGNEGLGFAFDTRTLTTIQGEDVFGRIVFANDDPGLRINNSSVVGQPILTDNGIIYVIDSVLLPQF